MPDVKATVIPKGGNSGGRPRDDGLVPGSEAAKEADRKKEAERSKRRRAEAKLADLAAGKAPTLPAVVTNGPGPVPPESSALAGGMVVAPLGWLAADFQSIAPHTLDLVEQWRIQSKIELAEEGKLAGPVVAQIGKDAAFPPLAKASLRETSPEFLARVFNACHIPIALKPYISTCPTICYLIVRDMQQTANIRKLIESEHARQAPVKPVEEKMP